jgi:hypothetical protein
MRILIYEHFSAGAADSPVDGEELQRQGFGMLRACVEDGLEAGHRVQTVLDRRLEGALPAGCRIAPAPPGQALSLFEAMLPEVDAVLPIAPETAGTLASLTSLVERSGKLLLGSSAQATQIAGDKFASALALADHGCKVPFTALWPVPVERLPGSGPWILKPRRGTGCEGICLTASPQAACLPAGEYVVQEYVPGAAASVAMIVGERSVLIASVNLQRVVFAPSVAHGGAGAVPHYRGGAIPLAHPLSQAARIAARNIPRAIAGLRGYVGVDVVLTGQDVYIIEVNPRITVAYCGLRRVVSENLMQLIIDAGLGRDLPDEIRVAGSVQFDDSGHVIEPLRA